MAPVGAERHRVSRGEALVQATVRLETRHRVTASGYTWTQRHPGHVEGYLAAQHSDQAVCKVTARAANILLITIMCERDGEIEGNMARN